MKPIITEKAVMMIESQNILSFETERKMTKPELKKEIENLFSVKVDKIRVHNKGSKKYVYAKLKKEFPAIDIASKLGII